MAIEDDDLNYVVNAWNQFLDFFRKTAVTLYNDINSQVKLMKGLRS